ncbi:unnamed protein product [Closterium sp. NIES-64]|nr:unnamed protein product [Closterium sp. NIES-64]
MAGLMVVGKRIARGADTRASVGDQWSGRRGGLPFVRIRCLSGPNAERADLLEKEQAVRDRGEGEDDATDTSQESERDDVAEAGDEVRKEDGGGQGDMPAEATEADPAPGKAERQAKGRRGELVAHEAREGRRTFLGSRRMAGSRAATRRTRQIRVSSMTKSGGSGPRAPDLHPHRDERRGGGSRSPDPRQHHGEADRARRITSASGRGSGEAGRARRIRRDIAAGGGEAGRARQIRISRHHGARGSGPRSPDLRQRREGRRGGESRSPDSYRQHSERRRGGVRSPDPYQQHEGRHGSGPRSPDLRKLHEGRRGGESSSSDRYQERGMSWGSGYRSLDPRPQGNERHGGGPRSPERDLQRRQGGRWKRRGASGTIVAGRKEGEIYDPRHLSRAGSAEGKGRMGACVSLTRSARKDGWGGKAMGSKAGSAEKQGVGSGLANSMERAREARKGIEQARGGGDVRKAGKRGK